MAYDRYDPRNRHRDDRSHWREERSGRGDWGRERGHRDDDRDDRGFFERAGEEISSWFGGSDDDHRRERGYERGSGRGWGRDHDRQPEGFFGRGGDRDHDDHRYRDQNRGAFSRGGSAGDRDYNPRARAMWGGADRDEPRGGRAYRPLAGDYGRGSEDADSEQFFAASGIPRGGFGHGDDHRSSHQRSQSPWGRDDYRRTSHAGSSGQSHHDPHYAEWRRRHVEELDSHYDEYRREHQSKFESDFGSWREQRQTKRQMLGQVREQMQVVGSDDQPVGTVERVAGDRIMLSSEDSSGSASHSLSCTDIERIEGDRVILSSPAEQARILWRDENRSRALFEREDQGSDGPHILDRSFEGTYRR
jgi:hypothetical protein